MHAAQIIARSVNYVTQVFPAKMLMRDDRMLPGCDFGVTVT